MLDLHNIGVLEKSFLYSQKNRDMINLSC